MSRTNVLKFDDYRDRRLQRLRVTESLCSAAPGRKALLRNVSEAASITGANRAAVVGVDEYGPGLVHPHVVLDLLSDRPRRSVGVGQVASCGQMVGGPGVLRGERFSTVGLL
jgi:hypothetical protein